MSLGRLVIRRAFDIGSGSIKCQVAEVDITRHQIHRVLYARTLPVLFFNPHGRVITSQASAEGLSAFQALIHETNSLNPKASVGIATEVFRSASNGRAIINHFRDATRIPISIVDPIREGRLSYLSALGLRSSPISAEHLVAWDAGAGSFQFTSATETHFDQQGSGTIHAVATQMLADFKCSRQDLLEKLLEYLHHHLLPKPDWLSEMSTPYFVGVGSAQSIFNQCRVLSGRDSFTQTDVENVLSQVIQLDPDELHLIERNRGALLGYTPNLANIPYVLPKLALLLAVMRKFQLDKVEFHQTHGNCAGLLVDSTLWKEPSDSNQLVNLKANDRNNLLLTFNWHLQKTCNYKCKFCYSHFADESTVNMDEANGIKLLNALKDWGVFKVNFAGGEPLLNHHLGTFLKHAHEIGLKTSIITNASRMTWSWLKSHASYIDQIGISCDSINETVNKDLGRGSGSHVAITERAFKRIHEVNQGLSKKIKLKLNTVVTSKNHSEDWTDFIQRNRVERWKVFKILKIQGENDDTYDLLKVTDVEFEVFKMRHAGISQMVPETNDDMTSSYIMITPDGRFFQNTQGKYLKSSPILDVGISAALKEVGFDLDKFLKRGGAYNL